MSVVKRVVVCVPQRDLSESTTTIPASFSPKTGKFSIPVPDHIADVVFGSNIWSQKTMGKRGQVKSERSGRVPQYVYGETIDEVELELRHVLDKYRSVVSTKMRRKIIVVTFRAQIYLTYGDADKAGIQYERSDEPAQDISPRLLAEALTHVLLRREDLGFAHSPALELTHYVCYEAGGNLYDLETMENLGELRFESRDENVVVLEWTEERERFFEEARLGLLKTIYKIDSFIKAVQEDPAKLDAWISRQPLLSSSKEAK